MKSTKGILRQPSVEQVVNILGRNDVGHTQYTSLHWGKSTRSGPRNRRNEFLPGPEVWIEIHFLNPSLRQYPKPRFSVASQVQYYRCYA